MIALHRGQWFFSAALLFLGGSVFAAEVVDIADIVDKTGVAQRVQRLENIVEGQGLANLLLLVEQLQADGRRLQGEIQELQHKIEGLEDQQRELYRDLDRRLQQLSQTEETLPPPSAKETIGDEGATAETGLIAIDLSGNAYQAAIGLLQERRYQEAIAAFNQFLQQYPDSSYQADAQYWLGETYYVLGDFGAAATAFHTLAEQHPESTKAPDAMLKQGLAYYELEQWEQAKAKFQETITRFPDSTAGRLAEERLDKMKREGHI